MHDLFLQTPPQVHPVPHSSARCLMSWYTGPFPLSSVSASVCSILFLLSRSAPFVLSMVFWTVDWPSPSCWTGLLPAWTWNWTFSKSELLSVSCCSVLFCRFVNQILIHKNLNQQQKSNLHKGCHGNNRFIFYDPTDWFMFLIDICCFTPVQQVSSVCSHQNKFELW